MNSLIHLLRLSEASEEFTGQEIFYHCLIFSDTWWPKLLKFIDLPAHFKKLDSIYSIIKYTK